MPIIAGNSASIANRHLDPAAEYRKELEAGKSSKTKGEESFKELGLGVQGLSEKENITEVNKFLRLFIEELKHQDPTNPKEGADMLGQLAQFSSVESLNKVDKSVSGMAEAFKSNSILGATSLIGKSTEVQTNKMQLTSEKKEDGTLVGKEITGRIQIPDLGPGVDIQNLRVIVKNGKTGEVVDGMLLGPQISGAQKEFKWDGNRDGNRILDNQSNPIEDGEYIISADMQINDQWKHSTRYNGQDRFVTSLINTPINSVSVSPQSGDITLHASLAGTVKLSDLKTIHE